MKIGLASDIHAELFRDSYWLPRMPSSDVLVLAGDIDVGRRAVDTVRRIAAARPSTFVLWVAGNHEFYNQNIDETRQYYRDSFKEDKQVYYLDNTGVTINGVTFLGCTLWSGFDCLGADKRDQVMATIANQITDFSVIQEGDSQPFLPQSALELYEESCAWIKEQLPLTAPEKTVVISHFPPSMKLSNPMFPVSEFTAYFSADCDAIIKSHQPRYWLYGHNHWSELAHIGKTVLVSNQLGYPHEQGVIASYNEELELAIDVGH